MSDDKSDKDSDDDSPIRDIKLLPSPLLSSMVKMQVPKSEQDQKQPIVKRITILDKPYKERVAIFYKTQKILRSAMSELYENNISIEQFFKNNPFPKTEFSKSKSKAFLDAVKLGEDDEIREFLSLDRFLVFEYDHLKQTCYHWAAKRGLLSTMKILVSYGNHLNLCDLNKRTPLYLAAKNNHEDVCKFLLDLKANPFNKSTSGKKPIDVTTHDGIKRKLKVEMDNWNIVDKWQKIMKFHKDSR